MAAPDPSHVGRNFVEFYFKMLNEKPDSIWQFYMDNARLSYAKEGDKEEERVQGSQAIQTLLSNFKYEESRPTCRITVLACQEGPAGSVVVMITGQLDSSTGAKSESKLGPFVRTFVLVNVDGRFWIANDVFRSLAVGAVDAKFSNRPASSSTNQRKDKKSGRKDTGKSASEETVDSEGDGKKAVASSNDAGGVQQENIQAAAKQPQQQKPQQQTQQQKQQQQQPSSPAQQQQKQQEPQQKRVVEPQKAPVKAATPKPTTWAGIAAATGVPKVEDASSKKQKPVQRQDTGQAEKAIAPQAAPRKPDGPNVSPDSVVIRNISANFDKQEIRNLLRDRFGVIKKFDVHKSGSMVFVDFETEGSRAKCLEAKTLSFNGVTLSLEPRKKVGQRGRGGRGRGGYGRGGRP